MVLLNKFLVYDFDDEIEYTPEVTKQDTSRLLKAMFGGINRSSLESCGCYAEFFSAYYEDDEEIDFDKDWEDLFEVLFNCDDEDGMHFRELAQDYFESDALSHYNSTRREVGFYYDEDECKGGE